MAKVIIKRSHDSWVEALYDVEEIYRIHWDNVCGGIQKRQNGYSLYGYIPYSVGINILYAGCSNRRYRKDTDMMKILIVKVDEKSEYYDGYCEALGWAGDKLKCVNNKRSA